MPSLARQWEVPPWARELPATTSYQTLIEELQAGRYLDIPAGLVPSGDYYLVGSGKAAVGMAHAVIAHYGEPKAGLLVTKRGHSERISDSVTVLESSHPVPDKTSVAAGLAMENFARSIPTGSNVLYLLSGGSSALLERLKPGFSLRNVQAATERLLRDGSTIEATNAYRKSVSASKGGGMAKWFTHCRVQVLVVSDVIGDDLAVVGSGPLFPHFHHHVLASNHFAVKRLTQNLEKRGVTVALGPILSGDTIDVMKRYAQLIRPMPRNSALVGGGECTVTVQGDGIGGRCQHFALAAAIELSGVTDIHVLSGSTDGTDGPTDVAGAVVNGSTIPRQDIETARQALVNGDSHAFLRDASALIYTGPTQSNINDVVMFVRS
jgi:hydroxypyruvate reductase